MHLSLKALTLLFCCVLMTVQYRAQQRRRAAAASSSSSDEQQPSASGHSAFSSLFSSASNTRSPSLYQRLGVPSDATAEQIRAAHRRLAMRYHPDKLLAAHCVSASSAANYAQGSSGDSSGHDMFIAIQEAYEVLSDQYERKRYDYALMTGMTYTRLPSAQRNVRGQECKQQARETPPFPAYVRRRPAAFTSTAHSTDADSGSSSTPQRVRVSRSFSSILSSPFVHVSPSPSTASATGTGSPPYHSPASSPSSTPNSPKTTASFLSPPSAATATTTDSTSGATAGTASSAPCRSPATAFEAGCALWSLLHGLFPDAQRAVASCSRLVQVAVMRLVLIPPRLLLSVVLLVAERRKRMHEARQRMQEGETQRRQRVHDEVSVGAYQGRSATEVR